MEATPEQQLEEDLSKDLAALSAKLDEGMVDDDFDEEEEDRVEVKDQAEEAKPDDIVREATSSIVPPGKSKATKNDMIAKLMKVQVYQNKYDPYSKSAYQRWKVTDLEEHLGKVSDEVAKAYTASPDGKTEVRNQQGQVVAKIDGGKALFAFYAMTARVLEKLSITQEDALGTNLDGLTRDIQEERESIEDCLREIYQTHGDVIEKWVSPTSRLLMISLALASGRAAENREKWLEKNPPEEPSDSPDGY